MMQKQLFDHEEVFAIIRQKEDERRATLSPEARAKEDAEAALREERESRWQPFEAAFEALFLAAENRPFLVDGQSHLIDPLDGMTWLKDLETRARQEYIYDGRPPTFETRDLWMIMEQLKQGEVIERFCPETVEAVGNYRCYACGEEVRFHILEDVLRAVNICCVEPGPCVVRLQIPSGIIAIGNDFRRHFPTSTKMTHRENIRAQKKDAELAAQQGYVRITLHESSGTIHCVGKDAYVVGRGYETRDPITQEDISLPLPGTRVPETSVVSGYWRSFADGNLIPEDGRTARVPVTPGTWEFTFHTIDRDWGGPNQEKPLVSISFRRVGGLDP